LKLFIALFAIVIMFVLAQPACRIDIQVSVPGESESLDDLHDNDTDGSNFWDDEESKLEQPTSPIVNV
jgi:hypothetical protein